MQSPSRSSVTGISATIFPLWTSQSSLHTSAQYGGSLYLYYVTPLLKSLQWFPVSPCIKSAPPGSQGPCRSGLASAQYQFPTSLQSTASLCFGQIGFLTQLRQYTIGSGSNDKICNQQSQVRVSHSPSDLSESSSPRVKWK